MQNESTQAVPTRKRVLLVEDDPDVRELVARALRGTYELYEAPHGLAALSLLAKIPRPDLIISDISMPHVSGLTLAERLRTGPLKSVPILFVTARDSFTDIVAGINAGARQYVTKPFKVSELRARVDRILSTP